LLTLIGNKQKIPSIKKIIAGILNRVKQNIIIKRITKGKAIIISDISIPLNPKSLLIVFNVIYIFPLLD
jgi:hypothetical protein